MFLEGWRTYIVIVLMAVYNLMVSAGWLAGVTETDWGVFINVILALLGLIFNKVGRNRVARYGK